MQLDQGLLRRITFLQRIFLALAMLVPVAALCSWLAHPVGSGQPSYIIMNPAAAALLLLAGSSIYLSERQRGPRQRATGQALALGIVLTITAVVAADFLRRSGGVYGYTTLGAAPAMPGLSLQTAALIGLLSIVVAMPSVREERAGVIADFCLSVLCFAELVFASEYLFSATRIFGVFSSFYTAPATLAVLVTLTFVVFGRRAEYGTFRILLGAGIGSSAARIAFPIILVMPFLLEVERDRGLQAGVLGPQDAAAIETSMAAVLALGLVLFLAWRIEMLEREVSQLSLCDELTDVSNRRGFYLLARQAMYVAQRSHAPLSVLFVDLDNLKQVNDGFGHDTGSRFLVEVAQLLKDSFRKTDVIGRVGGDEFVVAGQSNEAAMEKAVQRITAAAEARDAATDRSYPFCISMGFATMRHDSEETLEQLIDRADHNMYETKRKKKRSALQLSTGYPS